jgi:hypothetical protein
MANREVNLTKPVKTSDGLRFCPVAFSENGQVKPDYVPCGRQASTTTKVRIT